ncbi:hypothetical protein [Natronoarchaeum mannanilyticum]|uniref:Copper resistance protein D n=1 Tax=Natronoarchaeum mannanilyticum TaxID=926360 RepID=A0AAV3T6B6_9EURY
MPDPSSHASPAVADDLFDKYALPKVALTVILAASLVGTWTTGRIAAQSPVVTLAKWAYLVALGVLAGGLVWKHLFVCPDDLASGAEEYCAAMYARFDRIAGGVVAVLALSGLVVLADYVSTIGVGPLVVGLGGLLAALLGVTGVAAIRSTPVDEQFRSPAGLFALGLAAAVVCATALAEVGLRGLGPLVAGVRMLHLLAFAGWIGGAVWNIFVAVPSGQSRPTVPVARAAGEQLERFRRVVRLIIPTLFLTGAYQAVDALGTDLGSYLGSLVGLAVVAKIGFVAVLIGIFLLCPMWRACSPIDGVCDLEELGGGERSTASAEGPSDG